MYIQIFFPLSPACSALLRARSGHKLLFPAWFSGDSGDKILKFSAILPEKKCRKSDIPQKFVSCSHGPLSPGTLDLRDFMHKTWAC